MSELMKDDIERQDEQQGELNILQLPPRSEAHKHKERKKSKRRIKYFFVRFLTALFVVVPVGVFYVAQHYIHTMANNRPETKVFEEILFASKKKDTKENQQVNSQTGSFHFHTVEEGETLSSIAKNYFPDREDAEAILRQYNDLQEEVKAGQIIRIPSYLPPLKKEQ
ncbi:LysM peptidoglycan-binding domain-containing protein [Microbacteriaceae bacterium 4G12]